LINSGLEVNAPTYYNDENYGDLPLSTACFATDYEIAELLIKKGAVQSVWGARIPIYAATNTYEKGDLKLVKLLLTNGADKVVSGDVISEVIEATSPYKREGRIYTEEEEHEITLIFKELIKAGARVNQQVVVVAAKYNNIELLAYFIEEVGMDVNEGYKSSMMVTSNSPFETSYSPLIAASDNNSLEATKYLIEHGAEKSIKNNFGKIALDYAKTDEMRALLSQ
jgi:ankyrin repeat protein